MKDCIANPPKTSAILKKAEKLGGPTPKAEEFVDGGKIKNL